MESAKRHKRISSLVFSIALIGLGGQFVSGSLSAQDYLLQETQRSLYSPQIDIDGHYREPREPLDQKRRALERQNEEMVNKRIEDIRVRQEEELAKNLQQAFTRGMQAMSGQDQVSTQQAAPTPATQTVEVEQKPAVRSNQFNHENRLITGFGITHASGDFTDFESKIDGRIGFESHVSDRFAFGLGFGLMTMEIRDINPNNQALPQQYNWFGQPMGYYQNFQQSFGREMKYRQMTLDVDGKFYVLTHTRVRPFLGLGLGYRRSQLTYGTSDAGFNTPQNFNFTGQYTGDERFRANYVTGNASVGTDILLTTYIGARLQLAYSRGLTSGERQDFAQSMGEVYLRNVGRNLVNADFIGIGAGLVVSF